ncbi:EF-hand calcium-binding domain-containing protein 3 isoform X3 [Balearica regulorum gibbericeps]|uniref:EF-hand calcium-binding domain-containing protein 3 isoform X3 n=1 Tax=Balearica regulorum gibbericeps TaxID=100784 RepID=UPI003F61BDCC
MLWGELGPPAYIWPKRPWFGKQFWGNVVDIQDTDSNMGSMEVPLASEELQEALGHIREDTAAVDNLGSDLTMVETHFTPEPQEVPSLAAVDGVSLAVPSLSLPSPEISLENQSLLLVRCPAPFKYCPGHTLGYKGDTQDLHSILGSMASEVHLTSKEELEALGHMEGKEDQVDVSGEGSLLATPRIHSNPEELKEAKVNEKFTPPGCAPKSSVTPKPLPKKRVIKPLPRETIRDLSHIP